ncbi:hypothetical protein [Mycoplasma suis]|uniref:Uncharacterized protein n=2 Tax=Mycoplasma suis TaxID=57372 RepID=F0QS28_MYCSL|nr:hypothetical protein [Mycoplasma suis]ADX98298.1 hypothetical protein MSU_0773 [Mycoplasma suis str. Illinois]CBZ40813.1 hypothetical protein MSUIS_07200 [Mycoplasma suis KI3806]
MGGGVGSGFGSLLTNKEPEKSVLSSSLSSKNPESGISLEDKKEEVDHRNKDQQQKSLNQGQTSSTKKQSVIKVVQGKETNKGPVVPPLSPKQDKVQRVSSSTSGNKNTSNNQQNSGQPLAKKSVPVTPKPVTTQNRNNRSLEEDQEPVLWAKSEADRNNPGKTCLHSFLGRNYVGSVCGLP